MTCEPLKILTVAPASAVPPSCGDTILPGLATARKVTTGGAIVSMTSETPVDGRLVLPAAS